MIIYPAIDLIDGKAVRLEQGDYGKKTEYSADPASVAKQFEADGAEFIHIVDLDGAKAKKPKNLETVKRIAEATNLKIQLGGGIRSLEDAKTALTAVDRIIIGTVAITNSSLLGQMISVFGPDQIVVSIDYKDGSPAINGWLESINVETAELQNRLHKQGAKTVIITDVSKDGLMDGPNIGLMSEWRKAGFEVICAGGVTTVEDIHLLYKDSIDGAIIGKALYENKISLKEALDAV